MRRLRKSGFILSLVIVALGLLGVVMAVLGQGTNTMLFQADRAYLRAVERNLAASGLAWARHQALQQEATVSAEPIGLDTRFPGVRQASLTVSFTEIGTATAGVHVETACAKGRRTSKTTQDYTIHLAP